MLSKEGLCFRYQDHQEERSEDVQLEIIAGALTGVGCVQWKKASHHTVGGGEGVCLTEWFLAQAAH